MFLALASSMKTILHGLHHMKPAGALVTISSACCFVQRDEIKAYVDARYISASEACWRILRFSMHDRTPAVLRLAVHLQGQHVCSQPWLMP